MLCSQRAQALRNPSTLLTGIEPQALHMTASILTQLFLNLEMGVLMSCPFCVQTLDPPASAGITNVSQHIRLLRPFETTFN